MTVYSVQPGSLEIHVSDGRTLIGKGGIAWGRRDLTMGGFYLCEAILLDIYGDAGMARRYAQRMKWRSVRDWNENTPNAITKKEVVAIIDDIQFTEKDSASMVERMAREKPQFVTDRPAPGQAYDSNPELKVNPTRRSPHENSENRSPEEGGHGREVPKRT
jgi:hypothetical protein